MSAPHDSLAGTRRQMLSTMVIAAPLAIALWLALFYFLPPVAGMDGPTERLVFALKCSCVAILLCFVTGIEAVAHERLVTAAIDPLAGRESARMKINLRYLQNTLEQLFVFVPGLLALSWYCASAASMRAIVATTVLWIVARAVFWIGYHRAPALRTPGLVGLAQSLLVLVYVCGRFGYDIAGPVGAIVPLGIFGGVEAYLVYINVRGSGRSEQNERSP